MVVVVLGMHASGTSLIAAVLRAMGVFMGDRFMGPVKGTPTFEDITFARLNMTLIAQAGGGWSNPPPEERILKVGEGKRIRGVMAGLVALRMARGYPRWGWKDPRNSLTVTLWHGFLNEPYYVWIRRDEEAVARSLLERGPSSKTRERWLPIIRDYEGRIARFLASVDSPQFVVQFEDVVRKATADSALEGLARWLEFGDEGRVVEAGMKAIEFRG